MAVAWTALIAAAWHVALHTATYLAMFAAVWTIYAGDRLLDVALELRKGHTGLAFLHDFHLRHRRAFRCGILISALVLTVLIPRMPLTVVRELAILSCALGTWMLRVHSRLPAEAADSIPKELAVGFFFAAGTFLPTVASASQPRLTFLAPAAFFAAVCVLNCLLIRTLHVHSPAPPPHHPATAFGITHIPQLGFLIVIAASASLFLQPNPVIAACAASAALLLLLYGMRHRAGSLQLRAVADLALLTPLLWLSARALL